MCRQIGWAVLLTAVLWNCQSREQPQGVSTNFAHARKSGRVNPTLAEASGLVASRANPGYLWTHNDSGDAARIFLIDTEGKIVLTCYVQGATNRDWEDIAIGAGPDLMKTYLYVGDIGDNLAVYPDKIIYYFEEPVFRVNDVDTIRRWQRLTVRLPDGMRDSETLLADPAEPALWLVSKREDSVRMYEINLSSGADTIMARFSIKLPYHNINGGDISPDGREVLLRTYEGVYYWSRPEGVSLADALRSPGAAVRYEPEPQGEAIAFSLDGTGFYTLSESPQGNRAHLLFYKRNRSAATFRAPASLRVQQLTSRCCMH